MRKKIRMDELNKGEKQCVQENTPTVSLGGLTQAWVFGAVGLFLRETSKN